MNSIGIICEYNPFHNGHLYHLQEAKKINEDATIILVMPTNFTQRGDASILTKKQKTELALKYGIDLIIELPYVFAVQSADIYAYGAIKILKNLNVDCIVFGSETNDIELFKNLANIQLNDTNYQNYVKEYIDKGYNYPTASSLSLSKITKCKIDQPNDILALSYVREIIKQNTNITPISIKRTNDYNNKELIGDITSASSIREALNDNKDIKKYVPQYTYEYLKNITIKNYYPLLKYKIQSENNLNKYQSVDEGLNSRIKKYIDNSKTLDELIQNVKTKRYTYVRLNRMFTHILCNFTKDEAKNIDITYIRILGFSKKGRLYLNKVKKLSNIPIITNYSNIKDNILDIECRVNKIYSSVFDEETKKTLIEEEYKCFPIKSD